MRDIIIFKIGWTIVTAICIFIGYLIYFRKKYSILTGFKLGHFNEQTSKYIGLIIFIVSCKCLAIGIILFIVV